MTLLTEPAAQPQIVDENIPLPADPERLLTSKERKEQYRKSLTDNARQTPQRLKFLIEQVRQKLRQRDLEARLRRLSEIGTMIRYNEFDMWGEYKVVNGTVTWDEAPLMPFDQCYAIPVLTGHVREAISKMLKIEIEYEAEHKDKFDETKVQLAAMCLELGTKNLKRMFTKEIREVEAKNLCLGGESLRDVYWAPDPNSPMKAKKTIYKPSSVEIPGRTECGACGETLPEGATECSKCGATFVKVIPPGKGTAMSGEQTEISLCQNNLHVPNLLSIQYQMTAPLFRQTSYVIERLFVERKRAEWLYQTSIQRQEPLSEESTFQRNLALSGVQMDPNFGSASPGGGLGNLFGSAPSPEDVELEFHFWTPAEYGAIVLGHEEVLPNGKKLPAGTVLGEKYKNGAYLVFLGGELLALDGVNLLRRWSMLVYDKRASTPGGLGMRSLVMLNDIVNDSFNGSFAALMAFGQPLTAINSNYVDTLPEVTQYLKLQNLPEGVNVNQVIGRWAGTSDGGMGVAMAEKIESVMQFVEGTQTLGNYGGPTKTMSTATGVNAAESQSFGRMVAPTGSMITSDQDVIYQVLENIQEFSVDEQKQALKDQYGTDIFEAFMQCNFRQEISLTVKGDTDIPRSLARSVANITAFATAASQLKGLEPNERQEVLSLMGESLGISYAVGSGRTDRREAEYRLNMLIAIEKTMREESPKYQIEPEKAVPLMLEKLSKFCEGVLSETTDADGTQEILPNAFLHEDSVFMDVYKDYIFSERGRNASESLRMAALTMWYAHFKAAQVRDQKMALLQQKLQQLLNPTPPEPDPEDVAAAEGQARDAAIEEEGLRRMADEKQADNQLERSKEETEHAAATEILKNAAMSATNTAPSAAQSNGAG